MPNYHQWTDEELQIVRRDYRHTRQSTEELALRLGVTVNAVKGKVQRLGIASTSGRRRWTPEEDARLWELVPRYAMTTIAKKLGRGLNSVVVRSKRLGVTRRCRDGWYTMREVEAILAMDHRWIKARVDSGDAEGDPSKRPRRPRRYVALRRARPAEVHLPSRSRAAQPQRGPGPHRTPHGRLPIGPPPSSGSARPVGSKSWRSWLAGRSGSPWGSDLWSIKNETPDIRGYRRW